MDKLEYFTSLLTGEFNNKQQFENMKENGQAFVFARHKNTLINQKIENLPENFEGNFILEESIYQTKARVSKSAHIFLFTQKQEDILLDSYEIPKGLDSKNLSINDIEKIKYEELKKNEKFTQAVYKEKDGVFEGGSTSMFSPVLKFELFEKFSKDFLEVSESMYMNGKKTFGYDVPIIYRRV